MKKCCAKSISVLQKAAMTRERVSDSHKQTNQSKISLYAFILRAAHYRAARGERYLQQHTYIYTHTSLVIVVSAINATVAGASCECDAVQRNTITPAHLECFGPIRDTRQQNVSGLEALIYTCVCLEVFVTRQNSSEGPGGFEHVSRVR